MPIAPSRLSDNFEPPFGADRHAPHRPRLALTARRADACNGDATNSAPLSVAAALSEILAGVTPVSSRNLLSPEAAIGRVTAEPMLSQVALPRFDNSAIDGYAVHAADLEALPQCTLLLAGTLAAGGIARLPLRPGTAVRVTTGAPIPRHTGGVVPDEWIRFERPGTATPTRPIWPGANIRRRGEDIAENETLLGRGERMTAGHAALLAAAGITEIRCRGEVNVAVMSIGDELVSAGDDTRPSKIVDVNRLLVSRLLAMAGATVIDCGIVSDAKTAIADRLAQVRTADLLVTTGGAANSERDVTVGAIEAAGGFCRKLDIALKPGKSVGFGALGGLRTLHLPGNPIAALVTAYLFARPLVAALSGWATEQTSILVRLGEPIPHRAGRTEFALARLAAVVGGESRAFRCGNGGSAALRPLLEAQGLLEIPAESGDVLAGQIVRFHPLPGILL